MCRGSTKPIAKLLSLAGDLRPPATGRGAALFIGEPAGFTSCIVCVVFVPPGEANSVSWKKDGSFGKEKSVRRLARDGSWTERSFSRCSGVLHVDLNGCRLLLQQ